MSDETHITEITKVGNGTHHAMHVEGVVDGQKVGGLVNVNDFQAKEREGKGELERFLKDSLRDVHQLASEQRR